MANPAAEFDKELHTLYEAKPPVSASKIQTITKLALKHAKHYKNVVYSIERFIQKCNPEMKLAGLYVIDSIARAAAKVPHEGGENIISRFEEKLEALFPSLLHAPAKDKDRIKRTVGLWKKAGIFNVEQLEVIEKAYLTDETATPAATATAANPRDPRVKTESVAKPTPAPAPPVAALPAAAPDMLQQALAAGMTPAELASIMPFLQAAPQQNPLALLGMPGLNIPALGALGQLQLPNVNAANAQLAAMLGGMGASPAVLGTSVTSTPNINAASQPPAPTGLPAVSTPPADGKLRYNWMSDSNATPSSAAPAQAQPVPAPAPPVPIPTPDKAAIQNAAAQVAAKLEQQHQLPGSASHVVQAAAPTFKPPAPAKPAAPPQPVQPPFQSQFAFQQSQAAAAPSPLAAWSGQPQAQLQPPAPSTSTNNTPIQPRRAYTMRSAESDNKPQAPIGRPIPVVGSDREDMAGGAATAPWGASKDASNISDCAPARIDPNTPKEYMKVLSRTVYVGGITQDISKEDVRDLFEAIARVDSVTVNYPKFNAFVKMLTRAEAELIRDRFNKFMLNGSMLKMGWGCGYGPKEFFDYSTGETLFPLVRMTDADKRHISQSPRGGGPIEGGTVVEEPDVNFPQRGDTIRGSYVDGRPFKRPNVLHPALAMAVARGTFQLTGVGAG
ncbi:hypothetical protein HK097_005748, partial [Rhizophlyctis rosea]